MDCIDQQVTIEVGGGKPFRFSLIYAKCTHLERIELWTHIRQQNILSMPQLLGGDFNTIL